MKKNVKFLLMTAFLAISGNAMAQLDTGELIELLPSGVTANINPERKADKKNNLVVAGSPEKGYLAFFAASDDEHGEELWATDGTAEGTYMVKDIVEGSSSSEPCYLGRLNDKVLFSAYTEDDGREAWVSDGTEEGTFQLVDSYILGDGDPKTFIQMDETRAIFAATDDESAEYDLVNGEQQWLWITDGTVDGTYRVKEVDMRWPGQDNLTLHTAYMRVGRRVYFKADNIDGTTGEELWVTDGTADGTYCVMDINWEKYGEGVTGYEEGWTRNAGLDNLANYKNELCFFAAWTPDYGLEPWVTNGLYAEDPNGEGESGTENTYMIYDAWPGQDDSGIGYSSNTFAVGWEVYADRMWFRAYSPVYGFEFGGTNMELGDYVVYDIFTTEPTLDNNSYSDPGCIFDGVYMFCASEGTDSSLGQLGGELHYFDGENVYLQYDFVPGTGCDWCKEQVVAGGSMYWMNEDNSLVGEGYGTGLYRLDSKDDIPVVCTNITGTGDYVHSLRNLNGTIIFGSDATDGVYAYKYTKDGWDGESDFGYIEPIFDTEEELANKIAAITDSDEKNDGIVNVYTLDGLQVRANVAADEAKEGLQKGVYVIGNKKVVVR